MKRTIPLILAAALLLTSCTRWHLADRLRDPYTTYTGVDIYHPVDGKIHYKPESDGRQNDRLGEAYVIAPEVTFNKRSLTTNTDDFYPGDANAQNLRPTGRQCIVRITGNGVDEKLAALPKGLASINAPTTNQGNTGWGVFYRWNPEGDMRFRALGPELTQETTPGWWRRRAIDTCDYVVDPLLNVLTVAVAVPAYIVAGTIGGLHYGVRELVTQEEPRPTPEPMKPTIKP